MIVLQCRQRSIAFRNLMGLLGVLIDLTTKRDENYTGQGIELVEGEVILFEGKMVGWLVPLDSGAFALALRDGTEYRFLGDPAKLLSRLWEEYLNIKPQLEREKFEKERNQLFCRVGYRSNGFNKRRKP